MWDRCQKGDSPNAKTRLFDQGNSFDTKRQESRLGPLTVGQNGKWEKSGANRLIKEGALRRFVIVPARSSKSSNDLLYEARFRFVVLPMGGRAIPGPE